MKKYLFIIASILILTALIFVMFLPDKTNIEDGETVTLICNIEDMDVNTELSAEHSKIISGIFEHRELYDEYPPLCPCNKNFSFKVRSFALIIKPSPCAFLLF
jgi:hypothetical protein